MTDFDSLLKRRQAQLEADRLRSTCPSHEEAKSLRRELQTLRLLHAAADALDDVQDAVMESETMPDVCEDLRVVVERLAAARAKCQARPA